VGNLPKIGGGYMRSLVIGMGEVGSALYRIIAEKHELKNVFSYDIASEGAELVHDIAFMHICIPYTDTFVDSVRDYIDKVAPQCTIIHSSVPVGTCEQIDPYLFYSPVRGKHPNMYEGLKTYTKFVACDDREYDDLYEVTDYFEELGIKTRIASDTRTLELMKLLELCRYGVYIAFAKEQEDICKKFHVNYEGAVTQSEQTRNEGLRELKKESLCQPELYPFDKFIGGHCVLEDMELLMDQVKAPILEKAYEVGKGTTVWAHCNIYPTAKIGKGCSIGQFCEVGEDVVIGNNVRIGAYSFIPEGVTIEDDVFIAPKVTISNDKYPPSNKVKWGKVLIKRGAIIGMGSIILPGVTIGQHAVIGAGSVVTKDVDSGKVVYGQAAYSHGEREKVYK